MRGGRGEEKPCSRTVLEHDAFFFGTLTIANGHFLSWFKLQNLEGTLHQLLGIRKWIL